jgi:hypothetical protein
MAENSIGGLWIKESPKGKFFSGQIEIDGKKTSIVIFKNSYKEQEKHPDYKIFLSKPREEKPEAPKVEPEIPNVEDKDDSLPF